MQPGTEQACGRWAHLHLWSDAAQMPHLNLTTRENQTPMLQAVCKTTVLGSSKMPRFKKPASGSRSKKAKETRQLSAMPDPELKKCGRKGRYRDSYGSACACARKKHKCGEMLTIHASKRRAQTTRCTVSSASGRVAVFKTPC